jgi:hypothetical protein
MGMGDFEVITENIIETDLQGWDSGAYDFLLLQFREIRFSVPGDGSQLIEPFLYAGSDQSTFVDSSRCIIFQRSVNDRSEYGAVIQF